MKNFAGALRMWLLNFGCIQAALQGAGTLATSLANSTLKLKIFKGASKQLRLRIGLITIEIL